MKEAWIMKKPNTFKALLLSAALLSAVGAAAIIGNRWAASGVFASNIADGFPASVSAAPSADAYGETAEAKPPAVIDSQTSPPDEDGMVTTLKTLDNGVIVFLRYARGEAPEVSLTHHTADGRREVYNYEGDAAAAMIERFGGPKRENPGVCAEGQPDEYDISCDAAIAAATDALTEKYALRQETLDRFDLSAAFYSAYEDLTAPVWFVGLYPKDADAFSEIGCYTALIDSKTGEAVRRLSAADGKG
jgi:hypothetical protein